MTINSLSPTFKFASVRDSKPMKPVSDIVSIMPGTNLISSIASIHESNFANAKKLTDINTNTI